VSPLPRTTEREHARLVQIARECDWKPPPRRPSAGECCDSGCGLCIWDYYEIRLKRWRQSVGAPDEV